MISDFSELDQLVDALAQKLARRPPRTKRQAVRADAPHEEWDAVKNELKRIVNGRTAEIKEAIGREESN